MPIFEGWDAIKKNRVLSDINARVPVEECEEEMTDEEKTWYVKAAKELAENRAKYADLPIGYAMQELNWD